MKKLQNPFPSFPVYPRSLDFRRETKTPQTKLLNKPEGLEWPTKILNEEKAKSIFSTNL